MNRTRSLTVLLPLAVSVAVPSESRADLRAVTEDQEQTDRGASTWTDPARAAAEDLDFLMQGEYGVDKPNAVLRVQLVALSGGTFDAYLLKGGLPGLDWTKDSSRTRLSRKQAGESIHFASEFGDANAPLPSSLKCPLAGRQTIPKRPS